jgi:hypothetical protein
MANRKLAGAKRVNAELADARSVDARSVDAHIDEYAETQVLFDKPVAARRAPADDAAAQSVYSEYVQEIERMLKAETEK